MGRENISPGVTRTNSQPVSAARTSALPHLHCHCVHTVEAKVHQGGTSPVTPWVQGY